MGVGEQEGAVRWAIVPNVLRAILQSSFKHLAVKQIKNGRESKCVLMCMCACVCD